ATANDLPDAVPDEVREERRARFMEVAEAVSAKRLQRRVGTTMRVLIDEVNQDGGIARSMADAPEIDGQVFIAPPRASVSQRAAYRQKVKVGEFVRVRITGADGHDLWGELV